MMLIERIWAANELRNFHYLIACEDSGEALVIDPLDWEACLARAKARGWTIRQILNTHEHPDHTAGNAPLVRATGAAVIAHAGAAKRIGGVDRGGGAGDLIRIGRHLELECLDTPGHTMSHICLLAHGDDPALFSGDTLFNAGVGNCRGGGDPGKLFETCSQTLARLAPTTRVFPGHEYLGRNLAFTAHVEPANRSVARYQSECAGLAPTDLPILRLADEQAINSFFRLSEPTLIEGLRRISPQLPAKPSSREVFIRLRELRDDW